MNKNGREVGCSSVMVKMQYRKLPKEGEYITKAPARQNRNADMSERILFFSYGNNQKDLD